MARYSKVMGIKTASPTGHRSLGWVAVERKTIDRVSGKHFYITNRYYTMRSLTLARLVRAMGCGE